MIKGDGGVVGLIESFTVFRRWMVVGFEIVRVVREFENIYDVGKFGDIRYYE